MGENFTSNVVTLSKQGKWREILSLNQNSDNDHARKLLWVWPSEENLWFIKRNIRKFKKTLIISIGCGCGLLEWIIQQSTGIPVVGYEVNEEWWMSKYSCPQFIDLVYPELPLEGNSITEDAALLFCYFNDGNAFRDYIRSYRGNLVFIIGPGDGRGTHTNPEPFKPDFGESRWKLMDSMEIKHTKDFIAVYLRDFCNTG